MHWCEVHYLLERKFFLTGAQDATTVQCELEREPAEKYLKRFHFCFIIRFSFCLIATTSAYWTRWAGTSVTPTSTRRDAARSTRPTASSSSSSCRAEQVDLGKRKKWIPVQNVPSEQEKHKEGQSLLLNLSLRAGDEVIQTIRLAERSHQRR